MLLILWLLMTVFTGNGTTTSVAPEGEPRWERIAVGDGETACVAVAVDPASPARVVAAGRRAIYESRDGGARWERAFQAPAGVAATDIAVGSHAGRPAILAATDHGLYGSLENGKAWSRLFRGAGQGEGQATRIAFHPNQPGRILLGTRGGLFVSDDGGRHWREAALPQTARDIRDFAVDPQDPDRLHLVTAAGLFSGSLTGGGWQRRMRTIPAEEAEELEVEEPDLAASGTEMEPGSLHRLSAIAIDPATPTTLYLAGSRWLFHSLDGGTTWRPLTRLGVESAAFSRLLLQAHSPTLVYAATNHGVARYEPGPARWTMMSHGLAATRVHALAASRGRLWAATADGLYRLEIPPDALTQEAPPTPQELLANFSHEPTIAQVRESAIRYAEVHPDKIRAWRAQARLRALVPRFSFAGDTDMTDFRHWDSGPNPDTLLKGERDVDWSATISWEPADLIWSDDQTSIDIRSKLMVQLRDDIVDEITRTYFERRRLQVALLTQPPQNEQAWLDKELRLQELTALLDGLTGGYFSQRAGTRNQ